MVLVLDSGYTCKHKNKNNFNKRSVCLLFAIVHWMFSISIISNFTDVREIHIIKYVAISTKNVSNNLKWCYECNLWKTCILVVL